MSEVTEAASSSVNMPVKRDWFSRLWVPVVIFLGVRMFIILVAMVVPWNASDSRQWAKADAVHYLSIARTGYWVEGPEVGNTAWFPGYSYCIRALSPGENRDAQTAMVISGICCLICMCMVWGTLQGVSTGKAIACQTAFAFAPGTFFLHAISPVAMLLLIAMCLQNSLLKRQWILASALAALGAFTYSAGFILSLVACVWLLVEGGIKWRTKLLAGGTMLGAAFLAVQMVFALQDSQSGVSHAFYLRQAEFQNHGIGNPLVTLWRYIAYGVSHPGLIVQVPLFTVAVGAVVFFAIRKRWCDRDRLLAIYGTVIWLVPLTVGTSPTPWRTGVTPWRSMAMASPLAILMRKLPSWTIWLIILMELVFAALSVIRFGQDRLV